MAARGARGSVGAARALQHWPCVPQPVGWGSTSLPPHHRDKDLTPENSSWGQVLTGAPCCDPRSPRSRSSPWVQQLCPWMPRQPCLQLHPCCQGGRRQQLPFHTREKAALSSSPSHNPIKALLPGGSFSPGVLLVPLPQAPTQHLCQPPLSGELRRNFLSPDVKQQCPAGPPLTGD